ncbi:hypothetical protein KIN20_007987 [Parelaphostrongylus tenuis]|uniref:G protein-coupled receptor n=1 Tax=Parelaphostrongylus tenuis TaxID=148309 RepID=A0AAD5QME1_PARTN|nr:hypothetical protein KIN20_007987 [Parelaphostrongylus tenuis]
MCIERSVATIRSNKYESNGIALGLILFAFMIAADVAAANYVYDIDDFATKVLSMTNAPPTATPKFNHVAILAIAISLACIVTFHILSRLNKRRCALNTAALSARFQTRENAFTTQFATHIASIQVVFFIFYSSCGILIRTFGPEAFPNKALYASLRLIYYVNPFFLVVLSIYSLYLLKNYHLHRVNDIRSVVMMESRGAAGTRNYEAVVAKAWQLKQQP